MKKFIQTIGIFCAISSSAFAQKTTVSGDIKGLKDGQIVFYYDLNDSSKADTVQSTGGKFKWVADLPSPQKVSIGIQNRYLYLYAEPGNIAIKGSADALRNVAITGSSLQNEADAYEASLKDLNEQTGPLFQKYGKVSKEEQLVLEEQLQRISKEQGERAKKYIAAHPKSYFSLDLVIQRTSGAYESVKPLYDLLDPSLQNIPQGKKIAERLTVMKRSAIGEPVLDFTQQDQNGKLVRFSDFKGKYVLIDFWASWCGPCRQENPNVLREYNLYKDKNFTVVGVSLDDKADRWKKAIDEDKLPWTQVSDLKGFNNELSSYYGIRGIPSTLLIDPNGNIIARNLRGEMLAKKLKEIFN